MWPKAFAQFLELLPHITRLIPMADVFFATKTATEKANEATLSALAKDIRADLGGIASAASAYDGLDRRLQDHAAQIAEIGVDTRSIRVTVERDMERLSALERRAASLQSWLVVVLVFLFVLLAAIGGLIVLVLRTR